MFKYVLGIDFGTDSVRAILVNAITGEEISNGIATYPRWQEGKYCDPAKFQFRQHPLDYLEALSACMNNILATTSAEVRRNIVALSIDTTGSTPVAVDENNTPLALHQEFRENPNAMFILWKDHTAKAEASEITSLAHQWKIDYTRYSGGTYSPEWFWSKILHIVRTDQAVNQRAFSWVEHCDWIVSLLTGITDPRDIKRSRCAAGHKALWHEEFEGLPSEEFLKQLDPRLTGLRARLYTETYTSDEAAGLMTPYWANKLGLPTGIVVGIGGLDAHFGAVAAGIEPNTLVKVMGTSTCDMLTAPLDEFKNRPFKGICGQVNGSILPGMLGLEAGQSAFGDLYNWFTQMLTFPLKEIACKELSPELSEKLIRQILPVLSEKAAALPLSEQDPVALDWINGRRSPHPDFTVKSTIAGLDLAHKAPHVFKTLVEATAFGSRAIVENFQMQGVSIRRIVAIGGISKKSPFVLRVLADVLKMSICVVQSDQACALGGAMFASTAAGIYSNVQDAQKSMSSGFAEEVLPCMSRAAIYDKLYERYRNLGNEMSEKRTVPEVSAYFNLEDM